MKQAVWADGKMRDSWGRLYVQGATATGWPESPFLLAISQNIQKAPHTHGDWSCVDLNCDVGENTVANKQEQQQTHDKTKQNPLIHSLVL